MHGSQELHQLCQSFHHGCPQSWARLAVGSCCAMQRSCCLVTCLVLWHASMRRRIAHAGLQSPSSLASKSCTSYDSRCIMVHFRIGLTSPLAVSARCGANAVSLHVWPYDEKKVAFPLASFMAYTSTATRNFTGYDGRLMTATLKLGSPRRWQLPRGAARTLSRRVSGPDASSNVRQKQQFDISTLDAHHIVNGTEAGGSGKSTRAEKHVGTARLLHL